MSDNSKLGRIGWIDMAVDEILVEPRGLAGGRFCVIKDPAAAPAAFYQP